jgi:hypothetical protein
MELEAPDALDFLVMRWRSLVFSLALCVHALVVTSHLIASQTGQRNSSLQRYSSVTIDGNRQLHIVMATGREVIPPREKGQIAYAKVSISTDHTTVGWLVEYPDASVAYYKGAAIAGELVLFRSGKIFHRFQAVQVFWDWKFEDGGRKVAYSTGPTHGGAAECVLREVESGAVLAQWNVDPKVTPPEWARSLDF